MGRPDSLGDKQSSDEKDPIGGEVEASAFQHVAFRSDQVDTGAELVAGGIDVDPMEGIRIRTKIDWHILPLMCSEWR